MKGLHDAIEAISRNRVPLRSNMFPANSYNERAPAMLPHSEDFS